MTTTATTEPEDDDLAITFRMQGSALTIGRRYGLLIDVRCVEGPSGLTLECAGPAKIAVVPDDPTSPVLVGWAEPEGAPV